MDNLIAPYGGRLATLLAGPERVAHLRADETRMVSIDLTRRQLADLELLLTGAFSPLSGYLGRADYESVLESWRLEDGTFWPLPIVLDVDEAVARKLHATMPVALRDPEGFMVAVLTVVDVWRADHEREARSIFRTASNEHARVARIRKRRSHYVGGRLEGISPPPRHDFPMLRLTPEELRGTFARLGWKRILGFQTREAPHLAQHTFLRKAAFRLEAAIFLQVLVDSDPFEFPEYSSLVRSVQAFARRCSAHDTLLALTSLGARGSSLREILLRAIVLRNCGGTHLVVGGQREDAGELRRGEDLKTLLSSKDGRAALDAVGVELVPYPRMVYVHDCAQYLPQSEVPAQARISTLSGEEFERRLAHGLPVPDWYTFEEVLVELLQARPARHQRGFTVFFTGLSGSGKSTLARALFVKLLEIGGRRVTLLDGDVVRKHLSSELGFSREHRDINIRRIGFVASEITKHNGVAICAPIAPYTETRKQVREMIEAVGGFIEVYVSTPLEVCERRDRKGLYAKARAGIVKEFTGISDPYEAPHAPEVNIDTTLISIDEGVQRIVLKLRQEGYLR